MGAAVMETLLAYGLSFADCIQQIGTWAAAHPNSASILGGLIVELVVKYSPWKGADGLIEVFGKAILRSRAG